MHPGCGARWGNTTLGCYCFHFYFLPKMMHWGFENVQSIGSFDPSGFLVLLSAAAILLTSSENSRCRC